MEAFFPEDQPLRFWIHNASVSQLAVSAAWPPIVGVAGYAPCVRAWSPTSREEPEFRMAEQLMEMDGERCVAVTIKGDLLVAADASASGRVTVWDTTNWARLQTLLAGSPVTSLDATRTYVAAGTAAGYVRVWKRQAGGGAGCFTQFFEPDLQLDSLPIYCVRLGPVRDTQESMMVVHTRGNGRVSVWRMSDAKLMGTLGRSGSPSEPDTVLSANVVASCLAGEVLMTVSWVPGRDPLLQWVNPVARQAGELKEGGVAEALAGAGRPLSFDYDGFFVILGFENGMVWAWGTAGGAAAPAQEAPTSPTAGPRSPPAAQPPSQQSETRLVQWKRYHQGQVGAVACLPHRQQLASGGADGCVRLWSHTGVLLAITRLGWQVTALAVNELALVVGGSEGQIQLLVLAAEEHAAQARQRLTAADAPEAPWPAEQLARYDHWFDARSSFGQVTEKVLSNGRQAGKRVHVRRVCGAATGAVASGACGRATEAPDAFAAFVPARRPISAAELSGAAPAGAPSSSSSSSSSSAAATSAGGHASSSSATAGAEAHDGGDANSSGKSSSFNMQAALKGVDRKPGEGADGLSEEDKKRMQLRAMGEAAGVARNSGTVQLEGSTTALGRKCDNPSCLVRQAVAALGGGQFKRCGACKSTLYCSAHCQSTHWRDGHKRDCPQLAEAWKLRQQQQLAEQQGPAAPVSAHVAANAPATADAAASGACQAREQSDSPPPCGAAVATVVAEAPAAESAGCSAAADVPNGIINSAPKGHELTPCGQSAAVTGDLYELD